MAWLSPRSSRRPPATGVPPPRSPQSIAPPTPLLPFLSERDNKHKVEEPAAGSAVPAYLLDREQTARAKVLSNSIKQKRKEKAGKWEVPLPKVRPVAEDEMFKVLRSGKRGIKQWKRMITKVTFVGPSFTRKPPP